MATRRTLLQAAAAVATAGVPGAATQAAALDSDAPLLALCEEYTALDRAFNANSAAGADMIPCSPEFDALCAEGEAMVPRLHELEGMIAATRPRTRRGRLAKLEAARRSMLSDADNPDSELMGDRDNELPFAALEEALAYLGRRV